MSGITSLDKKNVAGDARTATKLVPRLDNLQYTKESKERLSNALTHFTADPLTRLWQGVGDGDVALVLGLNPNKLPADPNLNDGQKVSFDQKMSRYIWEKHPRTIKRLLKPKLPIRSDHTDENALNVWRSFSRFSDEERREYIARYPRVMQMFVENPAIREQIKIALSGSVAFDADHDQWTARHGLAVRGNLNPEGLAGSQRATAQLLMESSRFVEQLLKRERNFRHVDRSMQPATTRNLVLEVVQKHSTQINRQGVDRYLRWTSRLARYLVDLPRHYLVISNPNEVTEQYNKIHLPERASRKKKITGFVNEIKNIFSHKEEIMPDQSKVLEAQTDGSVTPPGELISQDWRSEDDVSAGNGVSQEDENGVPSTKSTFDSPAVPSNTPNQGGNGLSGSVASFPSPAQAYSFLEGQGGNGLSGSTASFPSPAQAYSFSEGQGGSGLGNSTASFPSPAPADYFPINDLQGQDGDGLSSSTTSFAPPPPVSIPPSSNFGRSGYSLMPPPKETGSTGSKEKEANTEAQTKDESVRSGFNPNAYKEKGLEF